MNSPQKVLIVDDDAVTRMMVQRVLVEAGFEVAEADSGQQGLEMCSRTPFNLVLLDVRMPGKNGFETCEDIRKLPSCADWPIMMLTSLDDVLAVRLAFEAGATDFITKPINWALLGHRVRYALRAKEQERQLRESHLTMARAQRIARLDSWSLNLETMVCECSDLMRDMVGVAEDGSSIIDKVLEQTLPEDRDLLLEFIDRIRSSPNEQQVEVRVRAQGSVRSLFFSGNRVNADGGAKRAFGVVQDVTERREVEARLSYQAHFDSRTGLPNRILLRDRIATAIKAAERGGPQFTVLEIATDVLQKARAAASAVDEDQILLTVANRIATALRPSDTLSRISEGRFAALVVNVASETGAAALAGQLVEAFACPIVIKDWEAMSSVHVGVALYPVDGGDPDTLMQHAGVALSRALEGAPSKYEFYTEGIQSRVAERIGTQVALFRALDRDEFVLYYQPLMDLPTKRVYGVEALIRWRRPGMGLQSPDVFIPILDESGLMSDVGRWVVQRAMSDLSSTDLQVAVNVSPEQFHARDLASQLSNSVLEAGFPPSRLTIEITEQSVLADPERGMAILAELSSQGIGISLDDYGTGYSSLQRLKQLPIDCLKIDRFFITNLLESAVDSAIVRSTIELCRELGVKVVAEGVENQAVMDRLAEYRCDSVQGYGIARPMPIEDLLAWLKAQPV